MRVLAVDPGPHVGLAYLDGGVESFRCWEETPEGFYGLVESWVQGVDRVVIETFMISGQRAREANETIEMIGVVRYFCRLHGKEMFEQSPADARMFGTAEKLRRIGWYKKGSDHARSAARHLLLHCATKRVFDPAILLDTR